MLPLYSHVPAHSGGLWWGFQSLALQLCYRHWFICSHCTNQWPCSYTVLLKKGFSIGDKGVSPSILTDTVRSVVSIGNWHFRSASILLVTQLPTIQSILEG